MQKDFKAIIAALLLLTLAGGGYLLISFIKEKLMFSSDPLLAQLERDELEKNYTALVDNVLKKPQDRATSEKLLPWLEARESQGFAPYLYATALNFNNLGNPEKAMLYYFRAGLIARIDLLRCEDKSAEKIVMQMEQLFPDVLDYLDAHPGTKISAGTLALAKEEAAKNRPLPEWLCTRGLKSLPAAEAYVPEEVWLAQREVTLQSFRQLISERQEQAVPTPY